MMLCGLRRINLAIVEIHRKRDGYSSKFDGNESIKLLFQKATEKQERSINKHTRKQRDSLSDTLAERQTDDTLAPHTNINGLNSQA